MQSSEDPTMDIVDALRKGYEQGDKFKEEHEKVSGKIINQGISPKDAMGLTPGYLENIYAQAYRLYNNGKYADASHLFRMLIMYNSMEPKYVMGLGACYHMMKDYVSAIQTYTLCSVLDPKSPIPHYHSSDCFIQMKEYLSAMVCLELTIERAGNSPEFSKLKERAQLGLEGVKKQALENPVPENPRSTRELNARPRIL